MSCRRRMFGALDVSPGTSRRRRQTRSCQWIASQLSHTPGGLSPPSADTRSCFDVEIPACVAQFRLLFDSRNELPQHLRANPWRVRDTHREPKVPCLIEALAWVQHLRIIGPLRWPSPRVDNSIRPREYGEVNNQRLP